MNQINVETNLIDWPENWKKRSSLSRFFSPVPVFGDDWKLRKYVNEILCSREEKIIMPLWEPFAFTAEELDLTLNFIKKLGNWQNALFHPQDNFSLLVCDNYTFQDASYDGINEIFKILKHKEKNFKFCSSIFDNLLYLCGDLPVVNVGIESSLVDTMVLLKSYTLE